MKQATNGTNKSSVGLKQRPSFRKRALHALKTGTKVAIAATILGSPLGSIHKLIDPKKFIDESAISRSSKDGKKDDMLIVDKSTEDTLHSLREEFLINGIEDQKMVDDLIEMTYVVIQSEKELKASGVVADLKERALDHLLYSGIEFSRASYSPYQINSKDVNNEGEFFGRLQKKNPQHLELFVNKLATWKIKNDDGEYEMIYSLLGYDTIEECMEDIKHGEIRMGKNEGEYARAFGGVYLIYLINSEYLKFYHNGKPVEANQIYTKNYRDVRDQLDQSNQEVTLIENEKEVYGPIITSIITNYKHDVLEHRKQTEHIKYILAHWGDKELIGRIKHDVVKGLIHHVPMKTIQTKTQKLTKNKKLKKSSVKKTPDYFAASVKKEYKKLNNTIINNSPVLKEYVNKETQKWSHLQKNKSNLEFLNTIGSISDIQELEKYNSLLEKSTDQVRVSYSDRGGLDSKTLQRIYKQLFDNAPLRAASQWPINYERGKDGLPKQLLINIAIANYNQTDPDTLLSSLSLDGEYGKAGEKMAQKLGISFDNDHMLDTQDKIVSDFHSKIYTNGMNSEKRSQLIKDAVRISPEILSLSCNILTYFMKQENIGSITDGSLWFDAKHINDIYINYLDHRDPIALGTITKLLSNFTPDTKRKSAQYNIFWAYYLSGELLGSVMITAKLGVATPNMYSKSLGLRDFRIIPTNGINTLTRHQIGKQEQFGENILQEKGSKTIYHSVIPDNDNQETMSQFYDKLWFK